MLRLLVCCRPFAKYFMAVWLLTIIIVSSIPNIPTLKIHTSRAEIRIDYLFHFIEYGLLALMAFLTFTPDDFKLKSKNFLKIAIGVMLFAILDEYHQKLIPGRSFNVMDILSNITGIMAASIFCVLIFRNIADKIRKVDKV